MIYSTMVKNEGCDCVKCGGHSPYGGVGMVAQRNDGQYDVLQICEGCLFKAVLGEVAFERWLKKKTDPEPIPAPDAVRPRFFA